MQAITYLRQQCKHYWQVYKTDQILKLYQSQKYDKIAKNLSTFKKYEDVKINDYNLIYFAISQENKEFLDTFLNKIKYQSEILEDTNNPNKFTPVTFSALNNLITMTDYLKDKNANIFAPNQDQNTLLHFACFYGKQEAVQYALENNFDINAQNQEGHTPLHLAIVNKHHHIVKQLLDNKADSLKKNNSGHYPIHEAIIAGDVEIVKLLENSLKFIKDATFTEMHLAAQQETVDILDYFTKGEYQRMSFLDKHKATPLHYAVWSSSEDCARYLLDHRVLKDNKDENGNTALHLAVLQKDIKMIGVLCQYNCDASILNNDKQSAIDLCYSDRDISLINYFRSQPNYVKYFRQQEEDIF